MKLVDPGPQAPPFEVEYSELEADQPKAERPDEEVSSNAEGSNEATTETVAETPNATVAVDASVSKPETDADVSSEVDASPPENTQTPPWDTQEDSSGEDTFGAGVDVGDEAPKPAAGEESQVDNKSTQQSADGAKAAEKPGDGQKKRGKRPNRRRRSRRGQKKNDGSPPKSES